MSDKIEEIRKRLAHRGLVSSNTDLAELDYDSAVADIRTLLSIIDELRKKLELVSADLKEFMGPPFAGRPTPKESACSHHFCLSGNPYRCCKCDYVLTESEKRNASNFWEDWAKRMT